MEKLAIKDVNKIYAAPSGGSLHALKDIQLTVHEEEFAVIVGPSGCGKSTLLNIVGGLECATSGMITVDGVAVREPGADRGMVFQGYSLFPWLTVKKNVEFGLRIKGIPPKERSRIADEYIELVGLGGFEDNFPKTLSGGMKQRVAIARTLANQPSLLLMDEPFGALDAQTRVVMQELLIEICKKAKTTVLFITHDIDEALLLGDSIYVMSRRPGCIREKIEVYYEGQRGRHTLLESKLIALKSRIMDMLWEESQQAALGR
jgi:NitT/TauT family transport system ATP-binding protein